MVPGDKKKLKRSNNYKLAASIICADLLNLKKDLISLNSGGIDSIHFDVMDGLFVPRYGLPPEMVIFIKKQINVPVYVHLMVEDPEPYIDIFAESGADAFVAHIEPLKHPHRFLRKVRAKGMKAGLALNPSTSPAVLEYLTDELDVVTLMAINPGILGHKLIPRALDKIADLKKVLKDYPNIEIEVDGGVSYESGPKMIEAGANILVCGTSSIFRSDETVDSRIKGFKKILNKTTATHLI